MSKELEALNRLKTFCLSETGMPYKMYSSSTPVIEEDASIVEQALKRNEPMKVDLKTKYVLPYSGTYYECPKCGKTVIGRYYNYCGNCGQRLAWSWSDEK